MASAVTEAPAPSTNALRQHLLKFARGYLLPACLYVAAKLNIADLLAEAGQVGSNLDMLLHVLIDSAYSTPV
jgi:hypothetical protein